MKECEWIWTHDQRDAFEEIKDAVKKKAPELKYFRKGDPTEGQGDASKNRLDFLLIQQGEPVTLPLAERKFSKIEK